MTSFQPPPPRLAERLLGKALGDGAWSEMILGDLHEEHRARATGSKPRAAFWYWRQVCRLGTMGIAARARRIWPSRVRRDLPSLPARPAGDSLMRTLGLEVRHACRNVLKRPAMSAIVVVTLGLGLGTNAAVFSMIDALVLRPFTMRDVDRITLVSYTRPDDQDRREALSPADYLDMKKQADVFERFAAFEWWTANLVGRDEPENVQGFFVSADFFPVLGVQPVAGRGFLPDDEIQGRHQRVVLGHGLWQRRFASDPAIVGRSIDVDGAQYEVVGIAPPAFDFPMGSQIWAPLSFNAEGMVNRRSLYITAIGRLAPGRTLKDAQAQMALIGERLVTRASGNQSRPRGACLHARRRHDGHRTRPDPLHVAGLGVFRAAHRVRERRQPAAGARRRAAARDGRAPGDWRQPGPRRARDAHRKRTPRAGGRPRRARCGLARLEAHRRLHASQDRAVRCGLVSDGRRPAAACLHGGIGARDSAHLRFDPRDSSLPAAALRNTEGRRTQLDDGSGTSAATPRTRGGGNGAGASASRRGCAERAHCPSVPERTAGLQPERSADDAAGASRRAVSER